MATYAIGDIQGCYDQLIALLETCQFSDDDTLWIAGDLVNRGPQSLETLRFLRQLGDRAKIVLGNHDLHLLAVYYSGARLKKGDTLNELLSSDDCAELMQWLRSRSMLVSSKKLGYVMTHAGLPPTWSVKQAKSRAREVEEALRSDKYREFFAAMYGNEPRRWHKSLDGMDRLRVITNYLTRMRFCTAEGELDFSAKGTLKSCPEGYRAWFHHSRPADSYTILFGHWAALEGDTDHQRVVALDTGCVWGNTLTALRLEDGKLFNVPGLNSRKSA